MMTPTQYQAAHRQVFHADAFTPEATLMLERMETTERFASYGRVNRIVGLVLEATGLEVGLGALCRVTSHSRDHSVLAEVVGFHERVVLLMHSAKWMDCIPVRSCSRWVVLLASM